MSFSDTKIFSTIRQKIKENRRLSVILLFSFIVCFAYAIYFQINPVVDAKAYDNIAVNLINGHGYREALPGDLARDQAIVRVGPLYEYFLAIIYYIFGHHYWVVWLIQALLHVASVYLIYLISRYVFSAHNQNKTIGLVAAGFFGFYPDLIENAAMLMTETFYLFLVCLMLYLFFKNFSAPRILSTPILGFVAGLATLARPPVLFLLPVILYFFLSKKKYLQTVLFVVILTAVFTPWTWRNYNLYGSFMPFGPVGSLNFWMGNYVGGNGEQEANNRLYSYFSTHTIAELNAESIRQFKIFVVTYPAEFIRLTALRINKYFSVIRPMGFWFYQTGWGQLAFILSSAAASVVLFIYGLGGVIKAFMLKQKMTNYLLVFTILTPLIMFITVVETRYRFQIYPFLAIFSGFFIVELLQKKWWREKIFWWSVLVVLCNGLVDAGFSFGKVLERLKSFL